MKAQAKIPRYAPYEDEYFGNIIWKNKCDDVWKSKIGAVCHFGSADSRYIRPLNGAKFEGWYLFIHPLVLCDMKKITGPYDTYRLAMSAASEDPFIAAQESAK